MAPMAAGRPEKSGIEPIAEVNAVCKRHAFRMNIPTPPSVSLSSQHLRGNLSFGDVYELKEEINQANGAVCKRCLHRVTAVEYSVKVGRPRSNFQQDCGVCTFILHSEVSAVVKSSLCSAVSLAKEKVVRSVLHVVWFINFHVSISSAVRL